MQFLIKAFLDIADNNKPHLLRDMIMIIFQYPDSFILLFMRHTAPHYEQVHPVVMVAVIQQGQSLIAKVFLWLDDRRQRLGLCHSQRPQFLTGILRRAPGIKGIFDDFLQVASAGKTFEERAPGIAEEIFCRCYVVIVQNDFMRIVIDPFIK